VADLYLSSPTTGLAALGAPVIGAADGSLSVSKAGGVARTTDGGGRWAVAWTEPGAAIRWVGSAGGEHDKAIGAVYRGAVAPQPIVVDNADGARWQAAPDAIPADDTAACALEAWALGPNGQVLHTTDGGLTWAGTLPSLPTR